MVNVRRSSRLMRNSSNPKLAAPSGRISESLDQLGAVYSPNPALKHQDILHTKHLVVDIPDRPPNELQLAATSSFYSSLNEGKDAGLAVYTSPSDDQNEVQEQQQIQPEGFEDQYYDQQGEKREEGEIKQDEGEEGIKFYDSSEEIGGNFEGEDFGEDQGFGEEDAGKDLDEEREDFGEDDMKQTPYETPDGRTRRLVVKSKYVPHTPSVGRYNTLIPLPRSTNRKLRRITWSDRRKSKHTPKHQMIQVRRSARISTTKEDPVLSTPGEKLLLVPNPYLTDQIQLPEEFVEEDQI
jgi:hypothetical protein